MSTRTSTFAHCWLSTTGNTTHKCHRNRICVRGAPFAGHLGISCAMNIEQRMVLRRGVIAWHTSVLKASLCRHRSKFYTILVSPECNPFACTNCTHVHTLRRGTQLHTTYFCRWCVVSNPVGSTFSILNYSLFRRSHFNLPSNKFKDASSPLHFCISLQ